MTPATPLRSSFMRCFLQQNRPHLDDFRRWLFQPGMLFQSMETWWGRRRARPGPHEGLDLYTFVDLLGRVRRIDGHTRIPAAFAGEVIKIDGDFLGQSIFLGHELWTEDGRQLISAYGHLEPIDGVGAGKKVAAGEILATLTAGPGGKSAVPVHAHLTFAWMPAPVEPYQLSWKNLSHNGNITLLDPLVILGLEP
jgi:murein DD-endopeptidase MepM/ murein hydrolase activator NlpD